MTYNLIIHNLSTGDGFNTVMQTAETALGAEPAEELAERLETEEIKSKCLFWIPLISYITSVTNEDKQEENANDKESDKKDNDGWGTWGSWGLSGITSAVGKATNVLESTVCILIYHHFIN